MLHISICFCRLNRTSLEYVTESVNIPDAELSALKDLYYSTNGAQWIWRKLEGAVWNFSGNPNPCSDNWQGVTCAHPKPGETYINVLELSLQAYDLNGAIPSSISNLSQLTILDLSVNNLKETIPSNVGSFGMLTELHLYYNLLTGTIPQSLGSLTSLTELFLYGNLLTGKIPDNLGSLNTLLELFLYNNRLTGTIPESFGSLNALTGLNLYSNYLSGTIPETLGSLSSCAQLALYLNQLTGTIPDSLGSLRLLTVMYLWYNNLTGTIPESFGSITLLRQFYINNNAITGTVPTTLGNLKFLISLELGFNYLSGTIPQSLADSRALQLLSAESNFLTGTIPAELVTLRALTFLSLYNNSLEGSLDGLFNSSSQVELFQVDLHNNQMTGSLPAELFRLPALSFAALASNCFTGTLPEDLCKQVQLQTLILDGLHTASSCKKRIWALSESYVVYNGVHGIVPACVFALPQLQTLHLSGNGFTGTLPENITLSRTLTELIVSHNAVTGTIPERFQNHSWVTIDVSNNLLSGSLSSAFGHGMSINGTVHLENNRLSGKVPPYLVQLHNVSALGSNLFSCKADKSNLPQHDSSKHNYQCGSDAFNGPYYALLAVAVAVVALLGVILNMPDWSAAAINARIYWDKYRLSKNILPFSCQQAYTMVEILCQVSLFSTIVIVVVLVPWYASASYYWGTYVHSYAYVVSAAFKSGLTPGVIDLCAYVIIIGVVIILAVVSVRNADRHGCSLEKECKFSSLDIVSNKHDTRKILCTYALMIAINIIAVVGANVAFVTATLKASSTLLTLVQILLSLFKFLWNAFYVKRMDQWVMKITGTRHLNVGFFAMFTLIGIINNIVVPCLVVAVLSPSCFYSVFDTPRSVKSYYYFHTCVGVCETENVFINYVPPYHYDYQCSSSFITYYAPTFVYLAITAALLTPILNMIILYLLSITKNLHLHKILVSLLPTVLKPASEHSRVTLDINNLISALFMYLGILLTFGVVFPPLAAAMCLAILSAGWQIKLSVGRLISKARDEGEERYQEVISKVEEDCSEVVSLEKLRSGLLLLIGCAFLFYALFVFDTIGDAEGFEGAYWVLIVMPLFTVGVVLAMRAYRYHKEKSILHGDQGQSVENGMELSDWSGKAELRADVNTLKENSTLNTLHCPDPV